MQPRHRIDIAPADVGYGLLACLGPSTSGRAEARLLAACGLTGRGLATLSVRSAWELLLDVVDWPAGSEVLVPGIGHPDMLTLIREHGYTPVPVDVADPGTLEPPLSELAAACTARTRAVLAVQLFGGRTDLGPLRDFARRRGLLLVEDAAQAFTGPAGLPPGPDAADVSLFSFGLIKTATAAGGALVVVADPALLARLRERHAEWPRQRRAGYAARLARVAGMLVLGRPAVLGAFFACCARTGLDPDRLITRLTRTWAGDAGQLVRRLRRRPSAPLLDLLRRRIVRFDAGRLARRRSLGDQLAADLPPAVGHLGDRRPGHTHWLFPVVVDDPPDLVRRLRAAGLDSASATSNLTAAPGPTDRSRDLLDRVVYLPVYPELPPAARARLRSVLAGTAEASRVEPPAAPTARGSAPLTG